LEKVDGGGPDRGGKKLLGSNSRRVSWQRQSALSVQSYML